MVIGLPPTPDLEKVRMGNYSLIWSGLIKVGVPIYCAQYMVSLGNAYPLKF